MTKTDHASSDQSPSRGQTPPIGPMSKLLGVACTLATPGSGL